MKFRLNTKCYFSPGDTTDTTCSTTLRRQPIDNDDFTGRLIKDEKVLVVAVVVGQERFTTLTVEWVCVLSSSGRFGWVNSYSLGLIENL